MAVVDVEISKKDKVHGPTVEPDIEEILFESETDKVDGIEPFIEEVLLTSDNSMKTSPSSVVKGNRRLSKTRMFSAILASIILMFSVEIISFIQKNISTETFNFVLKNATEQKN